MKLWLDDLREPPKDWTDYVWAKKASAAITALETVPAIDEVSLDHDLGDSPDVGDGYDVLLWIERQVRLEGYKPPKMSVHSANPVARERMVKAIEAIKNAS